jgi:GAF domain-containing protein
MQPIPETLDALAELDAYLDDGTLLDGLRNKAAVAKRVAPDLVGVSVASLEHGLTFTLVATDEEIAALDAVQYLSGGPCVEAADDGQGVATTAEDLFSEPRWAALARASAAAGVCSTLTFPILREGEVSGTVNLYGRTADAFDTKHAALATVFQGWAPAAVTNADLSFSTRRAAEQAPARLREDALVDAATGIVAASQDIRVDEAREQLEQAAARAGIPVATLARVIVDLRQHDA